MWQNKTLVITGRDAARTFYLRGQLVRFDSFMETTLSRRRDSVSLAILLVSLDEVLTDLHLRAEDNKIYKRMPKHPDPHFVLTQIGRLQKILIFKGGKASVLFLKILFFSPTGILMMLPRSKNSVTPAWLLFELTAFLP